MKESKIAKEIMIEYQKKEYYRKKKESKNESCNKQSKSYKETKK